jgi:translation initiation factor IF-1
LAKEDNSLRMTGVVHEVLPNAMFRVMLTNNHQIIAYLGGKMRKHDIKIIQGDNVEVEMSPYDLSKGRVVYRSK